jgi:histidine kinase 2/3/4 (cytokinin receptor)
MLEDLDMILVEKDAWGMSTGLSFPSLLLNRQRNLTARKAHKKETPMILLATAITTQETEKAKAMGFVETVIMKPLRPSLMAACLQQALGLENKGLQGQGMRGLGGREKLHKLIKGKNILVVDDNLVNRRVAAGALKKYGASVECCESGKAAIALLQPPHAFDACLMDIQMPEMDG